MIRFFILIINVLYFSFLFAQDFEVSPVELKFNASSGEIQVKKVTIRNYSNTKQQFSVVYSDYEINNEGKKVAVKGADAKHSCGEWLNVNPSFFELNPNETKEIDVILTVPHDGTGTKWGKLGVQPAVEQTASEADKSMATGVLVVPRITIWVTQTPKGNNNYKAIIQNLVEVSTPKDTIRKFSATIINTGENIISGKVFLAVADMVTAEEKKYPPVEEKIYPGASKTVTLTLPKKLAPGRYVIAAILDYGHRKPLEGTQIMIEQQ